MESCAVPTVPFITDGFQLRNAVRVACPWRAAVAALDLGKNNDRRNTSQTSSPHVAMLLGRLRTACHSDEIATSANHAYPPAIASASRTGRGNNFGLRFAPLVLAPPTNGTAAEDAFPTRVLATWAQ
jgi:hypothetical protein